MIISGNLKGPDERRLVIFLVSRFLAVFDAYIDPISHDFLFYVFVEEVKFANRQVSITDSNMGTRRLRFHQPMGPYVRL